MLMQLEITGQGRPLVIVGGGLTGVLSFHGHRERLAPTRRVVLAQPLGVQLGIEHAPLPEGYGVKTESAALLASLDDAGLNQPVDLVGWSTGGAIALDFTLDHPDRVRSLLLMEADTPWALSDTDRADPSVQKAEENAKRCANGVSEDELAEFMSKMLGGEPAKDHPRWPVWNAHRDALRSEIALFEHREDLARVRALSTPVLLVAGEGTERYNALMTHAIKEALPNPIFVEIPGGHLAPMASMDRFLDEMEAFQAQLGG